MDWSPVTVDRVLLVDGFLGLKTALIAPTIRRVIVRRALPDVSSGLVLLRCFLVLGLTLP